MKRLLTALLLLSAFSPPVEAKNVDDNHFSLAEHVALTGIDVRVNPKQCWQEDGIFGWYSGTHRELVVCQENKVEAGGEVNWTEEDLDTLRHEAHHLVQDCMDDKIDGQLAQVYDSPTELAMRVLGPDNLSAILARYNNYPPRIRVLELEAFAVARMVDPQEQIKDVKTYCM